MRTTVIPAALAFLNSALVMPQVVVEPGSLDHTKWKLIELNGSGPVAASGIPFTMMLEENSYLLSGCNLVSGKLRIDGPRLVFSQPAPSTLMACVPNAEAVDSAFTRLAGLSPTFRLDQDRLRLAAEDGAQWVFQKEPLPSKNAKTRFVYVAAFTKECAGAGSMKCLQVRDSRDRPWTLLDSRIVGFEHVPGIEYRLRIKEDNLARPAAGSPSVIWYLDMVIEQTVIDRKAADDYLNSKRP
jgi:heat shock protein HslJ